MFWTGCLYFVEVIVQSLAENVIRDMGHLGVMEIANGATINAQMELLQAIDYKIYKST